MQRNFARCTNVKPALWNEHIRVRILLAKYKNLLIYYYHMHRHLDRIDLPEFFEQIDANQRQTLLNRTDVTLWHVLIDPKHKGCANGLSQIMLHSTHRFHWRPSAVNRRWERYTLFDTSAETTISAPVLLGKPVLCVQSFSSRFASELTSVRRLADGVFNQLVLRSIKRHTLRNAIPACGDFQFWM